eukprot:COSAG03_NODE_3794_length_1826_cov_777.740591_3_plen_161_part_00
MFQHAQHCQLFDDKIRTQQATERQTSRLSMPPHHSSVSTAAIDSIDSIDSQLTRMQARSQAMIAGHEQQMSLWLKPQQLQLEQQQLELQQQLEGQHLEQSQQLDGNICSSQAFVSTAPVAPVAAAAVQKPRERQRERQKERQREDGFLLESFPPGNNTLF